MQYTVTASYQIRERGCSIFILFMQSLFVPSHNRSRLLNKRPSHCLVPVSIILIITMQIFECIFFICFQIHQPYNNGSAHLTWIDNVNWFKQCFGNMGLNLCIYLLPALVNWWKLYMNLIYLLYVSGFAVFFWTMIWRGKT
jgi:hypothetical protein